MSASEIRGEEQKKIEVRDEKWKKEKMIKKTEKAKKTKFVPLINDAIHFEKINYIDLEGNYHPNVDKTAVLQSFANRKKMYTLALIQPRTATCRLFLTSMYKEHSRKLQDANQPKSSKQLQLTWNIGDNDLLYRLKRTAKYLEQEGRLDIILGAKNPKLVRDRSQREAMLATIRSTLGEYGYEWKKMTGGFPMAELWFVGYPPKAERIRTQQDTATDAKAKVFDRNPLGDTASEDVLGSTSYKVRDRTGILSEADKEYKQLFASKSHETTPEDYWAKLAIPSSQTTSTIPDYSAQSVPSKEMASIADVNKRKTDEGSFDPKKDAMEAEEPPDGQDKLRSIAVKFSNLGSKSIFGSKLNSR